MKMYYCEKCEKIIDLLDVMKKKYHSSCFCPVCYNKVRVSLCPFHVYHFRLRGIEWKKTCSICHNEFRTHSPYLMRCSSCLGSCSKDSFLRYADNTDDLIVLWNLKHENQKPKFVRVTKPLKERPKLRKIIETLLREGYDLEELVFEGAAHNPKNNSVFMAGTNGFNLQAKKMLEEKKAVVE